MTKPAPLAPEDPVLAAATRDAIETGRWALAELEKRIAERLERKDEQNPVTDGELWRLAEYGAKMAAVAVRQKDGGAAPPDLSGFRAGATGLPSPRVGHHRVRVIEGERRPVRDTGRADRRRYNERARQEGSPTFGE